MNEIIKEKEIIENLIELLEKINLKNIQEVKKEEFLLCSILFRKYLEKECIYKLIENKSNSFHKVIHYSNDLYENKEYFSKALNHGINILTLEYELKIDDFNHDVYQNLSKIRKLSNEVNNKLQPDLLKKYSIQKTSKKLIEFCFVKKISYNRNGLADWIVTCDVKKKKSWYFYSDIQLFPGNVYSFEYQIYSNLDNKSRFYKIISELTFILNELFVDKIKNHVVYNCFLDEIMSMWTNKGLPLFNNIFYSRNDNAKKLLEIMKNKNIDSVNIEKLNSQLEHKLTDNIHDKKNIVDIFWKLFPDWIKNYYSEISILDFKKFYPVKISFILSNVSLTKNPPKLTMNEKMYWSKIMGERSELATIYNNYKNTLTINNKQYIFLNKENMNSITNASRVLKDMYSFEEEQGIFYNKYLKSQITDIAKSINENRIKELTSDWFYNFKIEKCHSKNESELSYYYFWKSNKINFLTDFAGVGKTTIVKNMITQINSINIDKIALMAPTHKALGIYGYQKNVENITVQKWDSDFTSKQHCVCRYNVVFIDEISLLTLEYFLKIINHNPLCSSDRKPFPPLLFIGDENQIKPINELSNIDFIKPILNHFEKDKKISHKIIESNIKIRDLISNNKIRYRRDKMGEIISKLHTSIIDKKFNKADTRLFNITYYSNEFDAINIIQKYKDEQSVILSPVNNGILGTNHLQITMSKKISELEINDEVMCDDKDNNFCNNGVTYKIIGKKQLSSNNLEFKLMEPGNKVILIETNDQERLIHSLDVLSIHKSQGSTFNKVIIVIPEDYFIDFEMFYTAITRAEQSIIFVAEISFKLPNWEYEYDENVLKILNNHIEK